jgi:hypothetical protein
MKFPPTTPTWAVLLILVLSKVISLLFKFKVPEIIFSVLRTVILLFKVIVFTPELLNVKDSYDAEPLIYCEEVQFKIN